MWLGVCDPPPPPTLPPLPPLTHEDMISHLNESVLSHINQRPVLSHMILQVMILYEYVFISLSETHEIYVQSTLKWACLDVFAYLSQHVSLQFRQYLQFSALHI